MWDLSFDKSGFAQVAAPLFCALAFRLKEGLLMRRLEVASGAFSFIGNKAAEEFKYNHVSFYPMLDLFQKPSP